MRYHLIWICFLAGCGAEAGTQPVGRAGQLGVPADTRVELKQFHSIEDFHQDLAQFETVFWDPLDSVSLRAVIRSQSLAGKNVLEIGTGTGLISLCCAKAGAQRVVATDINPSAIANADYNAEILGFGDRVEFRFVSVENPAAYAVIKDTERFDLIVSNPPWEDGVAKEFADYAYYDAEFALLDSLLRDLRKHLKPGGKALLAYGCVEAIRVAQKLGEKYALNVTLLDDRNLEELDEVFLPGLLLEVTPSRRD